MPQTSKIVLAVIITAIIISGGIYLWQNSKQEISTQQTELITYNGAYWTLQYPSNYEVSKDNLEIVTISSTDGKIMVGDFEPAAAPAETADMTQEQLDKFPKNIKYHGYEGKLASAIFYKTRDEATKRELEAIQTSIKVSENSMTSYATQDFSFDYPKDWKAEYDSSTEIGSTKVTVRSPDWSNLERGAEFLVWMNPPGSGYEYLVKDLGSSSIYLGNVLATKNLSSDESGKINAAILKLNKGNSFYFIKYEFVAETNDEKNRYFAVLDNIINTFKFNE